MSRTLHPELEMFSLKRLEYATRLRSQEGSEIESDYDFRRKTDAAPGRIGSLVRQERLELPAYWFEAI